MTLNRKAVKYCEFRRIFVTVLLFTFCTLALYSQQPDSTVRVSNDSILIPDNNRRTREPRPVEDSERLQVRSRKDSATVKAFSADSIVKVELEEGHSPRKAMIYSIVLPGLGQAYNKKYWKIPIVYGALGGVGYMIYYNTLGYRQAATNFSADPNDTNERYLRGWRRNLEMSYIGLVLVDALAVVDAYVDANLFYWDVNPDLTIRMEPSIQPVYSLPGSVVNNYGIRCRLTF